MTSEEYPAHFQRIRPVLSPRLTAQRQTMAIGPQIPRPEFLAGSHSPEIINNQNFSPNKNNSMNP